jgi:hypothetical protein
VRKKHSEKNLHTHHQDASMRVLAVLQFLMLGAVRHAGETLYMGRGSRARNRREIVRDSMGGMLGDTLGGSLGDMPGNTLGGSLGDTPGDTLGGSLGDAPGGTLDLGGTLDDAPGGTLDLGGTLGGTLGDTLDGTLDCITRKSTTLGETLYMGRRARCYPALPKESDLAEEVCSCGPRNEGQPCRCGPEVTKRTTASTKSDNVEGDAPKPILVSNKMMLTQRPDSMKTTKPRKINPDPRKQRKLDLQNERRYTDRNIAGAVDAWVGDKMLSENQTALVKAAQSKRADKLMGKEVAAQFRRGAQDKQCVQNVSKILHSTQGGLRQDLTVMLSEGLDTSYIVTELLVPQGYVATAKHNRRQNPEKETALDIKYARNTKKTTKYSKEDGITVELLGWFDSQTTQTSTTDNASKTRILDLSSDELYEKLYSDYPGLLRDFYDRVPESAWKKGTNPNRQLTKEEADILASQYQKHLPHFDQDAEKAKRKAFNIGRRERTNIIKRAKRAGMSFDADRADKYVNKVLEHTLNPVNNTPAYDAYQHAGPSFYSPESGRPALSTGTAENFDPATWEIRPPDDDTFNAILRANGIRYTHNSNPTTCPIHDMGPVSVALLDGARERLTEISMELTTLAEAHLAQTTLTEQQLQNAMNVLKSEQLKVQAGQRKLVKDVEEYNRHVEQYETCRAGVKEEETDVKMGDGLTTRSKIVMYRDFVNHHDCDGNKIHDYVLVVLYKDSLNQMTNKKYVIHNITSNVETNKADTYMIHDFMDHLLSGKSRAVDNLFTRLKNASFDGILDIVLSGDHGPQICSNNTVCDESTYFALYNVDVRLMFLCSYHAYNPCDAGGSVVIRLQNHAAKKGEKQRGSNGASFLVNTSTYANHCAFDFSRVNKPIGKLPIVKDKDKYEGLRKVCDIRFDHFPSPAALNPAVLVANSPQDQRSVQMEHTKGIARLRLVVGKKNYELHDFLANVRPKHWGKMCGLCSNNFQCPLWHDLDGTSCPDEVLPEPAGRDGIVQPDLARIQGAQLTRSRQKDMQKAPGPFPCRGTEGGQACSKCFYKNAKVSNTHMKKAHQVELEAKGFELYPEDLQPRLKPNKVVLLFVLLIVSSFRTSFHIYMLLQKVNVAGGMIVDHVAASAVAVKHQTQVR